MIGTAAAAATGASGAATLGISAAAEAALAIAQHYIGEGRKAANQLTGSGDLQSTFLNQVMAPLAQLGDSAAQHQAMEQAWPAFLQQAQQFAAQGPNQAKVVWQMLTQTPSFINTVTSLLGRNPFSNGAPTYTNGQVSIPATTMPTTATQTAPVVAPPTAPQMTAPNSALPASTGTFSFPTTSPSTASDPMTSALASAVPVSAMTNAYTNTTGSDTSPDSGGSNVWTGIAAGAGGVLGGLLSGLGGSNNGATPPYAPAPTSPSAPSAPSASNPSQGSATTPPPAPGFNWQKYLPYLIGGGASLTGSILSNQAAQQRNSALTTQATNMNALADQERQRKNYYAAALMPTLLQGLGNSNPNLVSQAQQQMNTAQFPTS